jgi:hypothetical protein
MSKELKILFTILSGFFGVWISQWVLGLLIDYIAPTNIFVSNAVLIFYPPFITIISAACFFLKKKNAFGVAVLIGGILYCIALYLVIFSTPF